MFTLTAKKDQFNSLKTDFTKSVKKPQKLSELKLK